MRSRLSLDLVALAERARSPNARIRQAAADALGRAGGSQAVALLLERLDEESDPDVIEAAGTALRRLGEAEMSRAILSIWHGDPIPAIRLRNRRLGRPLLQALRARWPATRAAAAEALGHLRDDAHVPPLITLLGDPFAVVRRAAARSLGRLGDSRALAPLQEMLADGDPELRRESVLALAGMEGDLALEGLLRALGDSDVEVRRVAAVALGRIGDSRAVPALGRRLSPDHPEPSDLVRAWIVWALGAIGSPMALPALFHALDDPVDRVAIAAAQALGRMGDPRAIPELERFLRWWESLAVRSACEAAIAAIRRNSGRFGSEVAPAAPRVGLQTDVTPAYPGVPPEARP